MLTVVTADGEDDYVARLPPIGPGLFPDYDLARQRQVQAVVGATGIPVAEPLALETDESWIGSPFLLMPRVAGHTLTTSPSYLTDGWLAKQPREQQEAVIRRFVRMLAAIHRLSLDSLDLGELTGGGPELSHVLDYWDRYLDWATKDTAGADIYRRGLTWCRDHLPTAPPPPCLLWGDPQLTNLVIDDDGGFAAVLDWEMSGRGPAELDLAWFLVLHEHAAETAGTTLPGDPAGQTVLEWYAAALGRDVADLEVVRGPRQHPQRRHRAADRFPDAAGGALAVMDGARPPTSAPRRTDRSLTVPTWDRLHLDGEWRKRRRRPT